ncbi:MAG: hypothetical protein M1608_17460 [Candidatus Omnitrophica bacterium]|nr:hypothetical protein [Candidatus Omnitrophota bacterium]
MASELDESDFIDSEFQAAQKAASASPALNRPPRPPNREELDSKVGATQQRLLELKRAQESLERERTALEETRRRQAEFEKGREEMLESLTRGLGLLEEAEFAARRDAEQMSKTLEAFREALGKVQNIHQESWTVDNYQVELTRALTVIENARMEWNSARLKWPLLAGTPPTAPSGPTVTGKSPASNPSEQSFLQLCKWGLALTWPLALIALAALVIFLIIEFGR